MKKILLTVLTVLILAVPVYGSEAEALKELESQLSIIETDELQTVINKTNSGISFNSFVMQIIKGEIDLSPQNILNQASQVFFGELRQNFSLIKNLFIVALLSALLKNLTDSLKNKAVAELGFYSCYVVTILMTIQCFKLAVDIMLSLSGTISEFMLASIPVMMSLVVMTGHVSGAYVFSPLMIFFTNLIMYLINTFLEPAIIFGALVQIINYLTDRPMLHNLGELIKNCVKWCFKGLAVVFLALLTLQKIAAPIMDNLVLKTARSTVGAVPLVGQLMGGAFDTVLYWTTAIKSGVLVALLVLMVLICAVPLIKILVIYFMFKLTAALIQPVCDDRMVKCIDSIGAFTALLLGVAVTVVVMFLISVMILLSF